MEKKLNHSDGFTLIEVLAATAIFFLFAVSFSLNQGTFMLASPKIKEELKLKELALKVVNELTLAPPKFSSSLTLAPEPSKTFEDFPEYEYVVEWKEFDTRPVITLLLGAQSMDGQEDEESASTKAIKRLEKPIVDNFKKQLWQVKVKVTNKETKFYYELTTWLYDENAKVKLRI